jgi:hypothetical protein
LAPISIDLRQRGKPVHNGHLNVEQNHIGLDVLKQIEQLHAVFGLGNHLYVLAAGEGRFHAGTKQGVIIGDGDFNGGSFWIFHENKWLVDVRLNNSAKWQKSSERETVVVRKFFWQKIRLALSATARKSCNCFPAR